MYPEQTTHTRPKGRRSRLRQRLQQPAAHPARVAPPHVPAAPPLIWAQLSPATVLHRPPCSSHEQRLEPVPLGGRPGAFCCRQATTAGLRRAAAEPPHSQHSRLSASRLAASSARSRNSPSDPSRLGRPAAASCGLPGASPSLPPLLPSASGAAAAPPAAAPAPAASQRNRARAAAAALAAAEAGASVPCRTSLRAAPACSAAASRCSSCQPGPSQRGVPQWKHCTQVVADAAGL